MLPELTRGGARALHLHAQGLLRPPRRRARKPDVLEALRRMRALQIDTISVVARSPYLVLFSRLGAYEPAWLDALLEEGALFEYWAHEACLLPIEDYPLYRHRMRDPAGLGWKYSQAWVEEHGEQVDAVLAHVRANGPVRARDFSRPPREKGAGAWWGWKPEKRALEMLFSAGELMVARREGFERVYDLRERVLPGWGDADAAPPERARRALVLAAVRALGLARAHWVADYFRMDRRATPPLLPALAEEGALLTARVVGWEDVAYIHPAHAEAAREAACGRLRATHTTVLSPFDPLVWDRGRALELWDFDYRLECYTPAPKRRWGYFVLPILRRGALVGRLDAKAHRRDGTFEVRSLWLEEGTRPTAALLRDLARALRACAAWHGTPAVALPGNAPAGLEAALAG